MKPAKVSLFASTFAGLVRLLTGVHAYRVGDLRERDELPVIYYANHASHLDALVIWAALPPTTRRRLRPVAAQDYWQSSTLRKAVANMLNCLLIPRENISRDNTPIPPMVEALNRGDALLIFPQGSRKRENRGFKSGIFHLCKALPELQCVPIYLANMSRILPAGEFLPLPLIATLHAGPPIQLRENENKHDFLCRCEQALNDLNSKAE